MRRGNLFWGLMALSAGVVFLLNNLGYLSFNVWTVIGPVFLIVLGVWFLIGRETLTVEEISVATEGAKSARVQIEHGAGRLTIGKGAGNGQLLSGSCRGGVRSTIEHHGDSMFVKLAPRVSTIPMSFGPSSGLEWNLALNPEVMLSLDLDTGAGEFTLDMRELRVDKLTLDTGLSNTTVYTPQQGRTYLKVDSGLASVKILVAEGMAGRIKIDQGLSSVKIDEDRFPNQGDVYQSPGYETAEDRVDIDLETGLGELTVR